MKYVKFEKLFVFKSSTNLSRRHKKSDLFMYEISPIIYLGTRSTSVLWNETEFTLAAVLGPRPQSFFLDFLPCPPFCLGFGGLRSVNFLVVLIFRGSLDNHLFMMDDFHPSAYTFVDCRVTLGDVADAAVELYIRGCLLYTSPSPRDLGQSRMPSSA